MDALKHLTVGEEAAAEDLRQYLESKAAEGNVAAIDQFNINNVQCYPLHNTTQQYLYQCSSQAGNKFKYIPCLLTSEEGSHEQKFNVSTADDNGELGENNAAIGAAEIFDSDYE